MELLTLTGVAIGLALDATTVAAAAGLNISPFRWRPGVRMAFHFGLFQALMPLIGWLVGRSIATWITAFDHWAAFLLLALVGGRMFWVGSRGEEKLSLDPSRGLPLVLLSVAVSIDALAVGFSLALLETDILLPVIIIGMVTGILSLAGFAFGQRLGRTGGRGLKMAGGVILIAVGLRILISHLTG